MQPGKLSDLFTRLKRPLILDGAIGSLLQEEEQNLPSHLWSSEMNLRNFTIVEELHKQYLKAGADIITTNTFRLGDASLSLDSNEIESLIAPEMKALKELKRDYNFLIAGSNGPAEDCYQKERKLSFEQLSKKHTTAIDSLWRNGADFVLNETMSHIDEILFTAEYCSQNKIEFITSIYTDENLSLLDGRSLENALNEIIQFNPAVISLNCISPETFGRQINALKKFDYPFGFYLNCGSGEINDKTIKCGISPTEYVRNIKPYLHYNPVFIGSCCGSSPEHTSLLRREIDELYRT